MFRNLFEKVRRGRRLIHPGIAVVILGVSFVAGRMAWLKAQVPAHRQEVVEAFGSINKFYERVQMNHDGSQFVYAGEGKRGSVVYLCETATGRRRIVCEGKGRGPFENEFNLHVWPWSPDDSAFVYFDQDELVVCPSDTNKASASLSFAGTNQISDLVWLNPSEFVFVANRKTLCRGQRQPNGQWSLHQYSYSRELANVTAVGTNEVAWLQDNFICRVKLPSDGSSNPLAEQTPTTATTKEPSARGLMLWLDASVLKQADQTPVDKLQDLSVYHNDAVKNATPPVFNAPHGPASLNGKGTIHFSSGESLEAASGLKTTNTLGIKGATYRTLFAVMRRAPGKSMRISTGNCGTKGEYCGICDQNYGLWLPAGTLTDNAFPPLAPSWNILSVVCDSSGQKGFVNGVLKGGSDFPMKTADTEVEIGLRIARSGDAKRSTASDGDFAELLIYNRPLNPVEQRQVEDYLSAKWFGAPLPSPGGSFVWLDPQMSGILSMDYSKQTGQFLFIRNEKGVSSLWHFDPSADKAERVVQVPNLGSVRSAYWIGNGDIAYTSRDPGYGGVLLVDPSGTKKGRIARQGKIEWHGPSPDGSRILLLGAVTNEPSAGIWQYDLAAGQLRSVIPFSDRPIETLQLPEPFVETFKLSSGRAVSCTIFPPANLKPGRRYPLLISDSAWTHFRPWIATLQNCGAYVALTKRDGWFDGIEQMGDNILGAYDHMVQKPNIDSERIFATGASAEMQYFKKMVAATPGRWRGIIMNNPYDFSDLSDAPLSQRRPKALLTAGGRENNEVQLKTFQKELLKRGIISEYRIYQGDGHVASGNGTLMDRNRDLVRFIFEE